MKLLKIDHSEGVPAPIATPNAADLRRLWGPELKFALNVGQSYAETWPSVHINVEDDRECPAGLTDFMLTVPFKIVSAPLATLMKDFGCKCEFLPLKTTYSGSSVVGHYFALNALHINRDALDRSSSIIGFYDEEFGLAEDVQRLALKDDPLGDAPLVYLRQVGCFVVSDRLADAMSDLKLVGLLAVNIERYEQFSCV